MRILYVTTISLTMNSFFKPHVAMLVDEGHHVDIACNYTDLELDALYAELGCSFYQIDFVRSPLSRQNAKAYDQLKKVIDQGKYDIVHCHTPVAAMITRLAARESRKSGTKVFYTAHGFHFYKGAPLLNWLVYFPVEWVCSFMTDTLITINSEDYALAKKCMHAKRVEYVPGVGVDIERYQHVSCNRDEVRRSIGVPEDAIVLLSVGELNDNKNHQIIIKAMNRLNEISNLHYVVAGEGANYECLKQLASMCGLSDRVHLLGYRTDVPTLYKAADIFCFPSHREGLGLAALEAMASGLPIITSNVHGINDYSENDVTGFKCAPDDVVGFAKAIGLLANKEALRAMSSSNAEQRVEKFHIKHALAVLEGIYDIEKKDSAILDRQLST